MQRLPVRIDIPLRVLTVWAILSGCLFVLGPWVVVIVMYSIPFGGVAVAVATVFARSIARRPILSSIAAAAAALALGCMYFHNAGVLSLLVTVPAGGAFLLSLKLWPVVSASRERVV
jgi:hypothetical protein